MAKAASAAHVATPAKAVRQSDGNSTIAMKI
jgi:hypothetical protein